MHRIAALTIALTGCATGSRLVAGIQNDPIITANPSSGGSCGAASTLIALGIDGVLAGAILMKEGEIGTAEGVGLGLISLDAVIGTLSMLEDCLGSHD